MTLPILRTTADLVEVARRVVWFEPPEIALANTARFLAYLMTYGTAEDVAIVRRYVDESTFKEALEMAPPGIFDERSWAYWNLLADRYPPPDLPKRSFPVISDGNEGDMPKTAGRPKSGDGDEGVARDKFAEVIGAFAKDPEVTLGRLFASDGLKVHNKIFAMLVRGNLVVKLPKSRVDALIAENKGERFDPGHGRLMKEWVVIASDAEEWLALAKEARAFVGGGTS